MNIDFFKKLYEFCDVGQIEIRELPKARQHFVDLSKIETISSICNKSTNYFFGVGLRNGGGAKENLTQIPSLYADIDFKDTPIEKARENVKNFPFKPSIAVESGGGVHLYWLLKEPCGQEEIDTFETANRQIAESIGADIASSEAARILRVPGTKNFKYDPARDVKILYINSYYYDIDSILELTCYESPQNKRRGSPVHKSPQRPQVSTDRTLSFSEGSRDEDLFHTANCLVKGSMSYHNTAIVLDKLASVCEPPFEKEDADKKVRSAIERYCKRSDSLVGDVRDLVLSTSGTILTSSVYGHLQVSTRKEKKQVCTILSRMNTEGLIERTGRVAGEYRILDNRCEPEDWLNATTETVDIQLPFGLGDMVHIMPGDIVLFSGVPGVGKTAVLLNAAIMNKDDYNVHYFSSELRPGTFKRRLAKDEGTPVEMFRDIKFYQRYDNYHDVLRPGRENINIVDYVKVLDSFYLIGKIMADIAKKLDGAIAIVSLQKQYGAKTGLGGMFSQFEPVLSVNLDRGEDHTIATIAKTKEYKEKYIKEFGHADGFEYHFKIVNGIRLHRVCYWHKPFKV